MGDKLSAILLIVNLLAVLGAGGTLFYTQILFKKPAITETTERKKLLEKKKKEVAPTERGQVAFEPLSLNLKPDQDRLHYVNFEMVIEVFDSRKQAQLEMIKPLIIDAVLAELGNKTYSELSTVQGRFTFKNKVIDLANEVAAEREVAELPFSDVYFKKFMIQ